MAGSNGMDAQRASTGDDTGGRGEVLGRVDYDTGAAAFRRARTLPEGVLATWREVVRGHRLRGVSAVVDVGCGTGQFLWPLAEWFGAAVVGVEPSAGMRAEARQVLPPLAPQASQPAARGEGTTAARRRPRTFAPRTSGARVVACVGGVAEDLPMRDASVDAAWLSTVVHHIGDIERAVAELRRVLRSGGHVLVRGYFADLPLGSQLRRFPGIERAAASFPTRTAVVETFRRGGFGSPTLSVVRESWEADVSTVVRRARQMRHVDSLLCRLTDDEFEAGLRAISEQASGDSRVTVDGILDFHTFRAP